MSLLQDDPRAHRRAGQPTYIACPAAVARLSLSPVTCGAHNTPPHQPHLLALTNHSFFRLSLLPKHTTHLRHETVDRFRESVTQTYEIVLQRPPGLILEQVWDSSGKAESVVVAGIVPGSPAEASGAVECGDTVVAVSSSLGNVMWPYR